MKLRENAARRAYQGTTTSASFSSSKHEANYRIHARAGRITAGAARATLSRSPSTPGNNLVLSVDIELQKIAEHAFGDRRGALIAIEPKTGDVLAFVAKPTFDSNLFVDGIDPKSWDELNNDPDKPLLNRALRGTYPIGSTYKPFLALAALETASGGRPGDSGQRRVRVRQPALPRFEQVPLGPVDLKRSIVKSATCTTHAGERSRRRYHP